MWGKRIRVIDGKRERKEFVFIREIPHFAVPFKKSKLIKVKYGG